MAMSSHDDGDGDGVRRSGVTPFVESREFPPASTTVEVTYGARSQRGRSRPINEDHYLVLQLGRHQQTLLTSLPDGVMAPRFDEYGYALVVADGMGDTGAGEAASHLAISTLVYLVRRYGKWHLRVDDAIAPEIIARVEWFYRHIDSAVTHRRQTGTVPTQETTLTAAFGAGRDLFFAHVGHSRAYLLRDRHLMRLTRDHTVGRRRAGSKAKPLVAVNASSRDREHILTDTLGMRGPVGPTIDIERLRLVDDDRVLVCTNGLTDVVDEDQIEEILAVEASPDDQCQSLVDLAMTAGGEDDVTALVARYRVPR
jgi:serine/threonine protein phosphatase PrpC